jgi:hypothetical protein
MHKHTQSWGGIDIEVEVEVVGSGIPYVQEGLVRLDSV